MVAACPDISGRPTVKPPRVRVCEECVRTGDSEVFAEY
jgi:hypothetical protein